MEQANFTEHNPYNLPDTLIDAVVEQIGDWETFENYAPDIANHGIDGGFNGFIYYVDTVEFARINLRDILSYAKEQADEFGHDGAYSLIASFNCANGLNTDNVADAIHDEQNDDHTQVMNCLAWYAGEEVARAYNDLIEEL